MLLCRYYPTMLFLSNEIFRSIVEFYYVIIFISYVTCFAVLINTSIKSLLTEQIIVFD